MDRKVTNTEWALIALNVVMLVITSFACGMAKSSHDAVVLSQQNRVVIGVPAWTRTNYSTLTYETNR